MNILFCTGIYLKKKNEIKMKADENLVTQAVQVAVANKEKFIHYKSVHGPVKQVILPIDLQDYTGIEITICTPSKMPANIIISMVKEEEALAPRLLKCKKALLDMLEPIKSVPGVEYRPLDNLILEGLSETIKKALTAYIKKKEILK